MPGLTDLTGLAGAAAAAAAGLRGPPGPAVGGAAVDARSRLALQILVATGGLVLYPLALGLGRFDPYRLGYANPWFLGGLLALAVAAGPPPPPLVPPALAVP